MDMETLWGFSWWWCLVPFLFMVLAMVGCFFMFAARRGGCACMAAGHGHERTPPSA
jgi:hypothetical protein